MTETLKDAQAAAFDGVQPEILNEPCAFKRACFRAGYDAGRAEAGAMVAAALERAAEVALAKHHLAMKWAEKYVTSFGGKTDSLRIHDEIQTMITDDHHAALAEYSRNRPEVVALVEVSRDRLGSWMSAALEDPDVCAAMKEDINAWFAALAAMEKDHGHD